MGKNWRKPARITTIETNWRGVFVTCPRGRETQCGREAVDWFEVVGDKLWPQQDGEDPVAAEDGEGEKEMSLEDQIKQEVEGLKTKKQKRFVTYDKLGCECVVFIQTRAPVDPVRLVLGVCEEAVQRRKVAKYVQRLAPVQELVHCDAELSEAAKLQPVIAAGLRDGTSYAIRPTLRLSAATRDVAIPAVARLVGAGHRVDLKNYEQLILVEGFKGVVGVAVVDLDAAGVQRYCRLNVQQICASAPAGQEDGAEK